MESKRFEDKGDSWEKTKAELSLDPMTGLRDTPERSVVFRATLVLEHALHELNSIKSRRERLDRLGMKGGAIEEGEYQKEVMDVKNRIRAEIKGVMPALKKWKTQAEEFDRRAAGLGSKQREEMYLNSRMGQIREAAKRIGMSEEFEKDLAE